MSASVRLPIRAHLRPKPRRDLLANVPPEVRGKLPSAFTGVLSRDPVYEQVDRDRHPKGWGYDLVRIVSIDEALAPPIEGQA
jgi:hypothetical protein